MGKLNKNSKGFGGFELFLVIIIVVLLGVVGCGIYKHNNKTTVTSTATTINPYVGWNTGTLQYAKLTYKYPTNWLISGSSTAIANENNPNSSGYNPINPVSPGRDSYTLTSPSGSTLLLTEGLPTVPYQGSKSTPITALGSNMFMLFGNFNSGELASGAPSTEACLSTSANIVGKDIAAPDSKYTTSGTFVEPLQFCYSTAVNGGASVVGFESDPNFAIAKQIIESMKYTN